MRWQVLVAKFFTLSLYSLGLITLLLVSSYTIGALILRPSGDLIVFGPMFGLSDQLIIVHPATAALPRVLLSYLLAVPMLMAIAAMTLMVSMLTRHFTSAAVLTITAYFCSYVVGGIPILASIHPYLPTRYFPFWKYALLETIPWDRIAVHASWTAAYTAVFLAVAVALFNGRDL